jgi:CheY-like chemotaxis protein
MPEKSALADLENIAPLHILLVDDDMVFLKLLQAMLTKLGVSQITIATNGSDAYAKLAKISKIVDCILCDVSMQAGNGLQLLQSIRQGKIKVIRPDTCFVLVTSSRQPNVVETAGQLDVNGYLVKPVTPQNLHAAIVKARLRPVKVDFERYAKVLLPLI